MCVARLCTDVYALDTVQWRQTHNRDTDKELITNNKLGNLLHFNRAHATVA